MSSFYAPALFTNTPIKSVSKIIEENWEEIRRSTTIKSKYMYTEGIMLCLCTVEQNSDLWWKGVVSR